MSQILEELRLLSKSAAARYLSIGLKNLNHLIQEGRIGLIQVGKRYKISLRELDRFSNENIVYASSPCSNLKRSTQVIKPKVHFDSIEIFNNLIKEF